MNKPLLKLLRWWASPKLPLVHVFITPENRPKGIRNILRVYFRKWIIHPIKRRTAKYYLFILQRLFGLKVVAITGSAGKTTTKEMLASIFGGVGTTIYSYKNIDPVYNIPTTVFKCRPWTKFLVLEFGVEYPGEMEFYLWLAKPRVGVITNIYPTHTLFFKDEFGVAKEKTVLVKSLDKSSFAVLNKDSKHLVKSSKQVKAKRIWFGKKADVSSGKLLITKSFKTKFNLSVNSKTVSIELPTIGKQFVENSLAAAAAAHVYGVSLDKIKKGLEKYQSPEHRMKVLRHKTGAILLDDSYNNNPQAAKAGIEVFTSVFKGKKKVIVFGDMLELGKLEEKYHRDIGSKLAALNVEAVIGVGKLAQFTIDQIKKENSKTKCFTVLKSGDVYSLLPPFLNGEFAIFIKGSRSIGLDKTVESLYNT
jgi:UDP-N-acetylmuramoyl-tripeptide--D-alanyl-D-alanine ligase